MSDRLACAAVLPVLGAGSPFSTEWGTFLLVLLLLAIQTALAYRRGKIEPPPPRRSGQEGAPAEIPVPGKAASKMNAPRGGGREIPRMRTPSISREFPPGDELLASREEGSPLLPTSDSPSTSPRSMAACRVATALLPRLRHRAGAREAFLGAEVLWNPPVALREPGNAGP